MQSKQRPAGAGHVLDLKKASIRGQHLFAANDAGTATEEEKRLAAMFAGEADLPLDLQRALDERRGRR